MPAIEEKLALLDWTAVADNLNGTGYSMVSGLLNGRQCDALKANYGTDCYRKTVMMERYRFGVGEYKYFNYPLPSLVQTLRENIYPRLVPIANLWMQVLQIGKMFPLTHQELLKLCRDHDQSKATALILEYGKGGYNTLHQDLYGEVYFPLQAVLFLNEPEVDFKGGEFVLVQQTPRAQSKAMVLRPKKGDLLIFPTNFRPVKGSKGHYRVIMKHGVSEVHSGERYTLGIIFHDAAN